MDGKPYGLSGYLHCSSVTHLVISSNEAKDVIMTEHAGLIDLHLPHPGSLVNTGEYFDCHVLATPLATPHLAKS